MSKNTSKLERMLATHNLDNLVFEKRQRKPITNPQPQPPKLKKIYKHKVHPPKHTPHNHQHHTNHTTQPSKHHFKEEYLKPQQLNHQELNQQELDQQELNQQELNQQQLNHEEVENYNLNEEANQVLSEDINQEKPNQEVYQEAYQEVNEGKISQKDINEEELNKEEVNEKKEVMLQQQKVDEEGVMEKRVKYHRKSKVVQTMKDQQLSDWSVSQPKRKKKQHSYYQQYNLNRIFRKTPRINIPCITVETNLSTTSLYNLLKDLPKFDIVHCSLPLQLLIQLTEIPQIIPKGFIFIWVEKGEIQLGYHLLNRWGFDVIDQIMWIKTDSTFTSLKITKQQNNGKQLFLNCKSTCLVGYKCPTGQKVDYCTKISNNIIFAEELNEKKPSEIYQIAELMMPGSRRLQIGRQIAENIGWFVVKHKQTSLHRCHNCFRTYPSLKIIKTNNHINILCHNCINMEDPTNMHQINTPKDITRVTEYHEKNLVCGACNKKSNDGYLKCMDCQQNIIECLVGSEHWQHNVESLWFRKYFHNFKIMQCSNCEKNMLELFYYQCLGCKDHELCNECFWKESNQDMKHEFRIRPIINNPQIKMICFQCESDCTIPYWSCQTCQNWFWCGSCVVQHHENYCHFNRKHQLSLMV